MLKYVLLASAMTIAAPAIAQQVDPAPQSAPAPATGQPDTAQAPANTGAVTTAPATAAPATTAQAAPTTPAPDPATGTPAMPARTATTEPAATQPTTQGTNEPDQVAAILDSEFPSYDKDKSGSLSKAEFASWMDALKAKADPSAKPDAKWNNAAFRKADADRSAEVSKTELATFLSSGAKQAG